MLPRKSSGRDIDVLERQENSGSSFFLKKEYLLPTGGSRLRKGISEKVKEGEGDPSSSEQKKGALF